MQVRRVEPSEEIILDACCLINLFGSGCIRDILADFPGRFLITRYVSEREALYTLVAPALDRRAQIDLGPLISEGLVRLVDLSTEAENATLIELATKIEDGEANTCALAIHRGYAIATDERKVLKLLRNSHPSVRTRTTSQIVKHWADATHASPAAVRDILRNIGRCARFAPNRQDPLFDWWTNFLHS